MNFIALAAAAAAMAAPQTPAAAPAAPAARAAPVARTIVVPVPRGHTAILGKTRATPAAAARWARSQGATRRFATLAPLYWALARQRGVRPEVAYAQAAKETAFGRYTGVLDASFRNLCGLKRRAGGGNYDPGAHQRFPSWRAGIAAHLDHLALYAGADGYPKRRTPDPRHFDFLHGTARSVQQLGGRWAPSPRYGRDLARLVRELVRA